MAFGDDDLSMMIADVFSVAASYGAQSCRGFFNDSEEIIGSSEGSAFAIRTRMFHIQTGDLTSVTVDSAITVDGTSYNITAITPRDDGKITVLTLAA